jgi:transposase
VECPEHGPRQIDVPWAESGSRFTTLFECVVIDWFKEASIAAVARQMSLSWSQADGIMKRAVQRGLLRREAIAATRIGIDETSYQKRHTYVTVVSDLDRSVVLDVQEGRSRQSIDSFYASLSPSQRGSIKAVAMDMWPAYINSTLAWIPEADRKIAFDRFHVARNIGHAVDLVRRQEHRVLRKDGDSPLTRSKYLWLSNVARMSAARKDRFEPLRTSSLRTARAWAIKESATLLWSYVSRGWAERGWRRWLAWASRSRLVPMVKAARTIRKHLWGIINAVVLHTTNATAESMNSKIQRIKRRACGYRNRTRFRHAILFHLGGLDLYPAGVTHTKA